MFPILSECDLKALSKPFLRPNSWVPPSGVGTVLQYEFKNPSELIDQFTAHSIELFLLSFSFFPEKDSWAIKVESFTSLTRKSSRPFEKLKISDLGILISSAIN